MEREKRRRGTQPPAMRTRFMPVVLNMAGKQDEAMGELRKACELDPKNAQHPYLLALLCGETGRGDEVVVQLKKAVAINP